MVKIDDLLPKGSTKEDLAFILTERIIYNTLNEYNIQISFKEGCMVLSSIIYSPHIFPFKRTVFGIVYDRIIKSSVLLSIILKTLEPMVGRQHDKMVANHIFTPEEERRWAEMSMVSPKLTSRELVSGMSWLIPSLVIPVLVAWYDGSTYAFGFSLTAVGLVLYFLTIFLMRAYIGKRAPTTLENDSWELTAGTGIVPKWVSAIGLIGTGLIPAGGIVVLLLWLGVIANRAT